MEKDYYSILGLPQNATSRQVRSRFLELARERHPDRFQGADKAEAETEFQQITQAFNLLSDPDRRREIDAALARPSQSTGRDAGQAAKVYLQRGIKAYKQRDSVTATENFDRATQEDPSNARAWHHLALASLQERRWLSRARRAIEKACTLDPMNSIYLKLAGEIFAQSGMVARAEHYFTEALNWGDEDPEVEAELKKLRRGRTKGGLFG